MKYTVTMRVVGYWKRVLDASSFEEASAKAKDLCEEFEVPVPKDWQENGDYNTPLIVLAAVKENE